MRQGFVLFASICLLAGEASANDEVTYRGHLVIDPEVEVFTPCGSEKSLWLEYKAEAWKSLAAKHWKFRKKPYDSSFIVVKGVVGPKLDCGFCESYEGSFKIIEVLEHRASSKKDCEQ